MRKMMITRLQTLLLCGLFCMSATVASDAATHAASHATHAKASNATHAASNATHAASNATKVNNGTGSHAKNTTTGHHNDSKNVTNTTNPSSHNSTSNVTSAAGICVNNDKCHHNGKCIEEKRHHGAPVKECLCSPGFKGENCLERCSLHCKNGGYCKSTQKRNRQQLRFLSNGTSTNNLNDVCTCPKGFIGKLCENDLLKQTNNDTKGTNSDVKKATDVNITTSSTPKVTVSSSHDKKDSSQASAVGTGLKVGVILTLALTLIAAAYVFFKRRKASVSELTTTSPEKDTDKVIDNDETFNDETEIDLDDLDGDKWNNTKELS